MKKNLSALSAPVSAPSAISAEEFSFCIPADCRDANHALLLADRAMRWFEDFDPFGVCFDDRAAELLHNAYDLLRCNSGAFGIAEEIEDVLEESFDEDEHESDLYQDGARIAADIRAYIKARNPWAKSPCESC